MFEYEHEFGAPVAVPFVYGRCIELIFKKQVLSPSFTHSVDGFLKDLESSNERTASISLSLSMSTAQMRIWSHLLKKSVMENFIFVQWSMLDIDNIEQN